MEYEKCYVLEIPNERPKKKRKIDQKSSLSSWEQRKQLYSELWRRQEQRINDVLDKSNRETLDNILDFIDQTRSEGTSPTIPTGIISGGPDLSSRRRLFEQLAASIQKTKDCNAFVALSSRDALNLKGLLRTLIQRATSRSEALDDNEDEFVPHRKGPRLLNYDLRTLQEWAAEHRVAKVVVAFEDSEAFDSALLAEAIDVLSTFPVKFVLLFGVATSVEHFQDRLPRATIRKLEGRQFDAVKANDMLERVFEVTIDDPDQRLWLGPGLCRMMIDRQNDHFQSVQAFVDAVQYAYMSHFYANPLSLFLGEGPTDKTIPKDHLEGVRSLASFRKYAEDTLEEGKTDAVRSWLDSDQQLLQSIQHALQSGTDKMRGIIGALKLVRHLRAVFQQQPDITFSSLYIKATAGSLNQSPIIRELLLLVKKVASNKLPAILGYLSSANQVQIAKVADQMLKRLDELIAGNEHAAEPLRSEHDLRHETLRTTVVAQKVELSKQKSSLTKQESEYSEIVRDLHRILSEYFDAMLSDPKAVFTHEIFMYDIKSPHRDSSMPRPRLVIERALSTPHDYLNCRCCQVGRVHEDESVLMPSNPPTSILYQLYLESGSLINVSDLYSAFNAIIGKGDNGDDEKRVMVLFQRALAELKYMGFMKTSRKKMDHVTKLAWKGL
ncbi:origin recognition complex subunit [Viridothelium virens]|uniref:Origin recognition complex subunit n=1 Tax=Viridothelium virens TaxID=1048519 RepID=A0A6A6H9C7_VIRVR|nr:origin recognition complex subunit [Viridothelium virens]